MPGQQEKSGRIALAAGAVSTAVLLSRILGLVREQVLAGLFGASTAMDAFVVAFRIPNLLRDLFGEGALSAAFVTVFTEYKEKKGMAATWALANNVMTATTLLLSLIILTAFIFSGDIVRILAPDFVLIPGKVELTRKLTEIMLPFLLFISLAALLMGILNTFGHFFLPSSASAVFNLLSITVGGGLALLFGRSGIEPIYGMAIGTLAGGMGQMAIQLPLVLKKGFRPRPMLRLQDPGLKKVGRLVLPAVIGLSATQLNVFINTNFASQCAEGSISWLNYAFRLMQLPIGLFGVAVSMASMPVMARDAARGESKELAETLVSSLVLASAFTVPASVGLWFLGAPIVRLIFEHGRFTPYDTAMTAEAIRFYSIGLMGYAGIKVVVPAFYAIKETRWPVAGSFLAVAANVAIILLTLSSLQHRAIALSTGLSVSLSFLLLTAVLYRRLGGLPLRRLFSGLARIAIAAAAMGTALIFLVPYMKGGTAELALKLALLIGVAGGGYLLLLHLMGLDVAAKILGRMRRQEGR